MGRGDEEPLDEVLLARLHALDALAAAALRAVLGERAALDVSEVGHGHDHVLLDDQVFGRDPLDRGAEHGAPLVAEALADLHQLLDHDAADPGVAGEQLLQVRDLGAHLRQLVEYFLALERGQRAQAHVEDRVRLALGEREAGHQLAARGGRVLGGADDPDHLVEVLERDREALEQVRARLGLGEVVGGPAHHHLAPEVDEVAGSPP